MPNPIVCLLPILVLAACDPLGDWDLSAPGPDESLRDIHAPVVLYNQAAFHAAMVTAGSGGGVAVLDARRRALAVRRSDSEPFAVVFESQNGSISSVTLSAAHDVAYFLHQETEPGPALLRSVRLTTGEVTTHHDAVETFAGNAAVGWGKTLIGASDGSRIAFIVGDSLYTLASDTSAIEYIGTGCVRLLAFTVNSAGVLCRTSGGVSKYTSAGTPPELLPIPAGVVARMREIAVGGSFIAATYDSTSSTMTLNGYAIHLQVWRSDGAARTATGTSYIKGALAPDGTLTAYWYHMCGQQGGLFQGCIKPQDILEVIMHSNGQRRRLAVHTNFDPSDPSISPDGEFLYYVGSSGVHQVRLR